MSKTPESRIHGEDRSRRSLIRVQWNRWLAMGSRADHVEVSEVESVAKAPLAFFRSMFENK